MSHKTPDSCCHGDVTAARVYRLSNNEVILWSVSVEQFIAEAVLVLLDGCLGAIVKSIQ